MNKKTIGYDETKKMLNTIRTLNVSRTKINTLREQSEVDGQQPEQQASQNVKNDITVINDVDVKLLSADKMDMQLTDEQKNLVSNMIDGFKQQVTNVVDLTPGLTINTNQIRLDGHVTDLDLKFTLVAGEETGLYINSDMTEINQQFLDLMSKFNRFYQTFIDSMNKLIDERKNN